MICYRCKKDLPPTSFHRRAAARTRPNSRRNYSGYCKLCQKIYYVQWQDKQERKASTSGTKDESG